MDFILSVFGANLVIIFGVFFYLWGFFMMFKNYNNDDYNKFIKTKELQKSVGPGHFFIAVFWPIGIIAIVFVKASIIIFPMLWKAIFKFFDKMTPVVKISVDKSEEDE